MKNARASLVLCELTLRLVLLLACCSAMALTGCATTRQSIGGWFGEATPPESQAARPSVYYAGTDGITMYGEPSASSKVVGRLSLHEKVTRSRLERGYAYVETDRGKKGWVNNALLIWRLPRATGGEAPRTEEPAVEAPQEEQQADETSTTGAEPAPAPTKTPAPGSSESQVAPAGVAPSIFDAY